VEIYKKEERHFLQEAEKRNFNANLFSVFFFGIKKILHLRPLKKNGFELSEK